jgi:hypothetical protein
MASCPNRYRRVTFHIHGLTGKNAEEYAGGKADDILAYCHGSELDNDVVLRLR